MNLNQFWLDQLTEGKSNWVNQIIQLHQERGYKVIRLTGKSHVYSKRQLPNQEKQLDYQLHVTFLIKKISAFIVRNSVAFIKRIFIKKFSNGTKSCQNIFLITAIIVQIQLLS